MNKIISIFSLFAIAFSSAYGQQTADKPLFRDPIDDGAADPVVIINMKSPQK